MNATALLITLATTLGVNFLATFLKAHPRIKNAWIPKIVAGIMLLKDLIERAVGQVDATGTVTNVAWLTTPLERFGMGHFAMIVGIAWLGTLGSIALHVWMDTCLAVGNHSSIKNILQKRAAAVIAAAIGGPPPPTTAI